MSRFIYLIYGTAVMAITTLINLSEGSDGGSSRGWSSSTRSSGSSWYSSGHHK